MKALNKGHKSQLIGALVLTIAILGGVGTVLFCSTVSAAEEFLPPDVTSEQDVIAQITSDSGVSVVSETATPIVIITKGLPVEGIRIESGSAIPVAAEGEAVVVVPENTHPSRIQQMIQGAQEWGYDVKVYLQHAYEDVVTDTADPTKPAEPAS